MAEKIEVKRGDVQNFVSSMVESSKNAKEVKPQTRFDDVNPADIEKVMDGLKRGMLRR